MENEPPNFHSNDVFVRLVARHERSIRAYTRSLLPYSEDVDDVMQEVMVIAWRKFENLNSPDDFVRWVCTIAKYQVLNYRRKMARDKLVLSNDIVELIAHEGIQENESRKEQLKALEHCVAQLPADRRNLIRQAYQPGIRLSKIAAELGKKENAIYQLLWRIRQRLSSCVDTQLALNKTQ